MKRTGHEPKESFEMKGRAALHLQSCCKPLEPDLFEGSLELHFGENMSVYKACLQK
jgi:hypothetical protein